MRRIHQLLHRMAGNRPAEVTPTEVGPAEAVQKIRDGAVLLDVREPSEWSAGHAPGARHIPLGQLGGRLDELPAAGEVVPVCRSGRRSAQAATMIARTGRQVHNVRGGMSAWQSAGLPVQTTGKRPGRIT